MAGFSVLLAALATFFFKSSSFAVLNPQGTVAAQQRDLIITATLLMLIVVVPVFIMTFAFAWRYREGNRKAKYTPDWDHNYLAEFTWWTLPLIIIVILSGIIWRSSHALDPYQPLKDDKKALTVQVVALEWKWLFIYPEQGIATVNYVQFPENTPINFEITADAPMNSFWIPQLGGQVYAMAGMETKLHLMADKTGEFQGSSANLSGDGFSGMKFTAKATTQADFDKWVQSAKQSAGKLGMDEYDSLSEPSKDNPPATYSLGQNDLHDKIIMKYMRPDPQQKAEEDNYPNTEEALHRH